jgi:DNA-binding XRE family transcriptional regulator
MKKHRKIKVYLFSDMLKEALKEPEFRKEWKAKEPERNLMRAILDARIKKGMTQAQIAKKAGTTQSAIARFEAGNTNPTLGFASRLSRAVGARLEIKLAPK